MTLVEDLGPGEAEGDTVDDCVADLRLLEVEMTAAFGVTAFLTVRVALVQFSEATSQRTMN